MASQQQQQPSPPRPWLRIASMARPTARTPTPLAQPSPPPQPRPPFIRPTFNQTLATPTPPPPPPPQTPPPTTTTSSFSAPPSPKLLPPSPPPPPPPPPVSAAPSPTTTTTATARVATPVPSPTTTKPQANTPSPSPMIKPHTPPPSPLKLPPPAAQLKSNNSPLEDDQKTVLVQEKTVEKPMVIPRASNPDLQWKINNTRTKDYGVFGMRVITIAGENRGAVMELSHSSSDKPQILYKKASDGEKSGMDSSNDEEGKKKNKDKSSEKAMAMHSSSSSPRNVFLNSNVQGENNSLLYNCSCTHNDPGIHLSLSRNTNGSVKDRMHSQK
ncbi:formin-like protein 3 [Camellia sinensis]|uniref:formin-like protein 3 n=1 Tax=Camellia sinensis TaxID=4442 RepID=UPI0010364858|nr:formin-like protein 3 [Camellia sinensis]